MFSTVEVQLTFEEQGFELFWSTYGQIFFDKSNTVL